MSARRTKDVARRSLIWFCAMTIGLFAVLAGGVLGDKASWAPRLGLDLAGGTQMVLSPRADAGVDVTSEMVEQARDIIVQRVDSQGVSGAEVTTMGSDNIVVSMPGVMPQATEDAIRASTQMQFRPVLATDIGSLSAAEPAPAETGTDGSASPSSSSATSKPSASGGSRTSTPASRDQARAPMETSATSTTAPSSSASEGDAPVTDLPLPTAEDFTPSADPTGPIDPNWITPAVWKQFQDLDCVADADKPIKDNPRGAQVACSDDNQTKYVVGPVVVPGSDIADASAGYATSPQGAVTNEVEIQLSFQSKAREAYGNVSKDMVQLPDLSQMSPINPPGKYNALATVLDGKVLMAPGFREAITGGQASISGGFAIEEARTLAKSLKFGALPISFQVETKEQISPTLGAEQLKWGLIAGILGLILVIGYSVAQYRALAVVTIGSMVMAFLLTYFFIAILGWLYNYRLDMAGVTGLIIAIGVTADSFIVYFERVRDELREGRNLRAAVEAGWGRAKRTILVADGVNFVAAVILYVLASSGVRGFAFTLGLTTLLDLLVFWFFTHPLLALLARTKFFGSRHKWSGFDVKQVDGATARYAGRGKVTVRPATATSEGGR